MKELRLSEMLKMENEFKGEGINIHLSESMTDEEREKVLGEIQMALYLLKAEEFGYATGGIFKGKSVTPKSNVDKMKPFSKAVAELVAESVKKTIEDSLKEADSVTPYMLELFEKMTYTQRQEMFVANQELYIELVNAVMKKKREMKPFSDSVSREFRPEVSD